MNRTKTIVIPEKSPRKVGIVESDGRDKTRKVVIRFSAKHPKYGKYMRKRTVLHAHDENNESRVGDRVEIAECRPLSRTKSWIVTRIITRAVVQPTEVFGAPV